MRWAMADSDFTVDAEDATTPYTGSDPPSPELPTLPHQIAPKVEANVDKGDVCVVDDLRRPRRSMELAFRLRATAVA